MNNSAHIPQPMADRDGMSASRVSRHAAAWRGWTIAGLLIALAGAAAVTFVARRACLEFFPFRKGRDLTMSSEGFLDCEPAHAITPKGIGILLIKFGGNGKFNGSKLVRR